MSAAPITPVTLELPGGAARLEPLRSEHAASLFEALGDGSIWRYMADRPPATREEMQAYVENVVAQTAAGDCLPFAIVDRGDARCIGSTRMFVIDRVNRSLEIGYTWIGRAWQRTRVNTECKYLLMRHAFERMGMIRVQLKTDSRNTQSQNAILRIGAKFEGCLRRSRVLHDGYVRDTMLYSVIDGEWAAVKQALEAKLIR